MEDNGEHDESNTEIYRDSRGGEEGGATFSREEDNAAGISRPRNIPIIRQTRNIV